MGFSTIANSKQPTFFERLIVLKKVTTNEFAFYLGRSKSGTQGASELTLGGRDASKFSGTPKANKVTTKGYVSASSLPRHTINTQADTGRLLSMQ